MGENGSLNYSAVNHVNMAADGNITCPQCGAINVENARFCKTCGFNLAEVMQIRNKEQAAFPVNAGGQNEAAFPKKGKQDYADTAEQEMAATSEIQENEPISAFAEGLPDWNIEPPQVMVRRKSSK